MLNFEQAQEGLRERKKRQKQARIVRAARRLFEKKGFEQTTTREIARRAGVGVGTVFVYFPEKTDLLLHVFREDIDAVQQRVFETLPESAPLVDQLMHVFAPFYGYYAEHPGLARVFVKELMFLEGEQRELMTDFTVGFIVRLAGLVSAAQRRGEVAADVSDFQAASQCFSFYTFALINWVGGALMTREVALAQLESSLRLLMRGLQPRGDS